MIGGIYRGALQFNLVKYRRRQFAKLRLAKILLKKILKRQTAKLWQLWYRSVSWHRVWKKKYRLISILWIFILFASLTFIFSSRLQTSLETIFTDDQSVSRLHDLIQGIGAALIGAVAIVSSLLLFALQVNVERMPYGLFRRLGMDKRLLGSVAIIFLLAICVAVAPIFGGKTQLAYTVLFSSWSIALLIFLFWYSYQRALDLISPSVQLEMLLKDGLKELSDWGKRATRSIPLMRGETDSGIPSFARTTHDLKRAAYFQIIPNWDSGAKLIIQHAMTYARRYAAQGDYDVSKIALNTILVLNKAYIVEKGKTFFTTHLLVDIPFATDGFINETLENLRMNIQNGINRQDEQQIEQTFETIADLVGLYGTIDYSSLDSSKYHANLAASYLAQAVESVCPRNMADVLIAGFRNLRRSAEYLITFGDPNDAVSISEKIATVSWLGSINQNYRPVTSEGMSELANLTSTLLLSKRHDIRNVASQIRQQAASVVKIYLKYPEDPLSFMHSNSLGLYYSSTKSQNLQSRLREIVNAIAGAEADNDDAKQVIRNIERWSDQIFSTERELFVESIKAKSSFTPDIINWITGVTTILLATSNTKACDDKIADKIRNHAHWLIATLSFVPDNEESVGFAETHHITDALFDAAHDALQRDCSDLADKIVDLLIYWTFMGGKYQTGWSIIEKGLCGVALFAVLRGAVNPIKSKVNSHISRLDAPDQEIRHQAARRIRDRIASPDIGRRYSISAIDSTMAQMDQQNLQNLRLLLDEFATLLSAS